MKTTWPMMFLSGVWFSLEGANPWLVRAAQLLPLTHMIDAARAVMVDGATLLDVWPQLALLTGLSVVFMGLGSVLFRWE
jgi:ABC-type multidrug transport system permease subunit